MADVRWAAFNMSSKESVWRRNAFHLQRAVISTRSGRSDVDTIDFGMDVPGRGLPLMLRVSFALHGQWHSGGAESRNSYCASLRKPDGVATPACRFPAA